MAGDDEIAGTLSTHSSRGRPLRVRLGDAEDVTAVSAYLQDAILPISEMAYDASERRFVMVAQRFRWELVGGEQPAAGDGEAQHERVHCGIRFENVTVVRTRKIDRTDRGQFLNLLAIQAVDRHIDLAFAGDGTIRLEVDRISGLVEDIGEPWPTVFQPKHPDTGEDAGEDAGPS